MDILGNDIRFLLIRKKYFIVLGFWPYGTQRKDLIRLFHYIALIVAAVPQFISVNKNSSNWDRVMENVIILLIIACSFCKLFTLGSAQKKLRVILDGMVDNWNMIVDEQEKQILREYAESGRKLTKNWLIFFVTTDFFFILGPLVPLLLNIIYPKSEWPYLYMLNGEYLIEDINRNYFVIYCWDVLTALIVSYICVTTDTVFFVCIEHCRGLFAIVRYRIQRMRQLVNDTSVELKHCSSYDRIVETIKLHQKSLQFVELLETCFSTCFLFILGFTVASLTFCCILIAVSVNQSSVQVIRFTMVFLCLALHLLNFCWPGQNLIDISTSLVHETYLNEWLQFPLESKKALLFFMLRCSNECALTAWGLVVMNFENFSLIVKTAISYIMVLGSIRKIGLFEQLNTS